MNKTTIAAMLFALAAWLYPIKVASAQQSNEEQAIFINYEQFHKQPSPEIQPTRKQPVYTNSHNGQHSTRAEKEISEELLSQWLLSKGSPLAPYASDILASPYWSTIIGICTIEQYGCTKAPYNNYWGIMCKGKLCRYETLEDGIKAIDSLLAKYEAKGKDTIEKLNGYYVVPASDNWLKTVLKTKLLLENLQ